jgi:ABC-type antimicrobial peptide transport system permease subunit
MAMGASRRSIRLCMMAESLCLMAIAIPPALLVYLNFLSAEILDVWRLPFNVERVIVSVAGSMVVMAVVILGGVLRPALRASAHPPAEALQHLTF